MTETTKRWKLVGDLIRTGGGTPELNAEYDALHAAVFSAPVVPTRSIYDLPIAERMWNDDARDVEGRR